MWRVQLTFHHSWRLITAVSRSREHDSPYDSHAKLVTRLSDVILLSFLRNKTRLYLIRGHMLQSK